MSCISFGPSLSAPHFLTYSHSIVWYEVGIAKHVCATSHAHFLPGSDLVLWQALIKSNMHCGRAVRLMKDPFYSLPPAPESDMNNPRSVLNLLHIYYLLF